MKIKRNTAFRFPLYDVLIVTDGTIRAVGVVTLTEPW